MKQKMTNHLAENNEQSKRRIQELENLLSESRDLLAKSETQLKYEVNLFLLSIITNLTP